MAHHNARTHTVITPSGVVVSFTGISKFAKDNGLAQQSFSFLINGYKKEYKGYRLAKKAEIPVIEAATTNIENDLFKLAMGVKR